ncbi:MAG: tyrosine-type recombinase/integrase [Lachnospiraceae bacterium]|nr:tyrosine-type recombinase/integrase [Lachnospiraceae bacterium]
MSYQDEMKREMTLKLRELLREMPSFCREYFRGIEPSSSERTRLGYARDLIIFFDFLLLDDEELRGKQRSEITLEDLKRVDASKIEEFLDYVTYYNDEEDREHSNGENGKARKLAAIRSLFKYLYRHELLPSNPATLVGTPKIHEKTIVRMDVDEIARFLDGVESGEKLTKKQQAFHKANKVRDLAIMTLMLGTGIRVSECVGLDIRDVDFNHNGIHIVRKGGNESVVYFGNEVREALKEYMVERQEVQALPGHENALFLSLQKRRITVRSVENLVKKYSENVITMKHISPHKLRSSYGTELYNETGDIYLVADVLGHKDVNTTRRHYAQLEDARRREAAKYVRLRSEDEAGSEDSDRSAEE